MKNCFYKTKEWKRKISNYYGLKNSKTTTKKYVYVHYKMFL